MGSMTELTSAPTRPGLTDLVERIRPLARRRADPGTTARLVADVLAATAPGADLLTGTERAGSPENYSRHTLHAEAAFSVSAVVWRPGQVTEIHDHLVWCSFMVLQGTETETLYDVAEESGGEVGGGRPVAVGELLRPAGSVSGAAPPDDVHRVRNAGDTVAVTLHVYGADLTRGSSVRRVYR